MGSTLAVESIAAGVPHAYVALGWPHAPSRGQEAVALRAGRRGATADHKQTAQIARHWHAGLGRRRRLIEAHAKAGCARSSAHRHLTS